nr:MAG TPA: hypothetical protein [Caudoviricetes sp.]
MNVIVEEMKMTVRELIGYLEKCDQDQEYYIDTN